MPTTETIDALNRSADETQKLRAKLGEARYFARFFYNKWLRADIGRLQYKLKNGLAENERDALREELKETLAELASIADAESDSAMWAQQAERERDALKNTVKSLNEHRGDLEAELDAIRDACDEARERNETLANQLRWLSIGIVHNAVYQDPGYRHVAELVLEGETCPVHDFDYPCPGCAIVALEAGVHEEADDV